MELFMRTCHLKDSQILLNQKSRSFRPLSCLFSYQSDTGLSLLHCHELSGRTKSRFSYEENKVQVFFSNHCGVSVNNPELNCFISPLMKLILLMSGPSWKENLEGLCCAGLNLVLGTDQREHHPTK